MSKPKSKIVVQEVPRHGFQRRLALSDPKSGQLRCTLVGGVPYSAGQPTRFQRAKPILSKGYQFGKTEKTAIDYARLSNACPQPVGKPPRVSEDCLQLNIWIPAGKKPKSGWPVLFFIHGGFLAWGSNDSIEPSRLLSESKVNAVIVSPNYRLSAFGFACSNELNTEAQASGEVAGNLGFWDQRLALEWTDRNVAVYGGNPDNITVAGLSAGAYSTFHQLAYDIRQTKSLIRRVFMMSNGCGLQPKPPAEVQSHWQNLLKELNIAPDLSGEAQLRRLRALPYQEIVKAVKKVPENSYRAVTDGQFVRETLFRELQDGSFARRCKQRGIKILLGECKDEFESYRLISPPSSYDTLVTRLAVEYPESNNLAHYYAPNSQLPVQFKTYKDLFGHIYADTQVHVSERGLLDFLSPILTPGTDIFRYRINYRTESAAKQYPGMGVCHASDLSLWFVGNGQPLSESELKLTLEWVEPWAAFINGDQPQWKCFNIGQYRVLAEDGSIRTQQDKEWKHMVRTFKAVQQKPPAGPRRESKL